MRPSYSILKKILIPFIFCIHINPAFSGEIETAVTETITAEYLKEQLKFRLADYLNKNPAVVNSMSPTIGTDSLRLVGKSLALYGLATAKNDHDRAWSATYLILSPEPTTALILIAVQLTDTLLAMKSQARLAEIYAETAEIKAQTTKIIRQIGEAEYSEQRKFLDQFTKTVKEINDLQDKIKIHPVSLFLIDRSQRLPEETDLIDALQMESQLNIHLNLLDQLTAQLNFILTNSSAIWDANQVNEHIQKVNQDFDLLRLKSEELNKRLKYFISIIQGQNVRAQVREDLSSYAAHLRVYEKCCEQVNLALSLNSGKMEYSNDAQIVFIQQCQKRFNNLGELK